jgi:hypothetical protein
VVQLSVLAPTVARPHNDGGSLVSWDVLLRFDGNSRDGGRPVLALASASLEPASACGVGVTEGVAVGVGMCCGQSLSNIFIAYNKIIHLCECRLAHQAKGLRGQ